MCMPGGTGGRGGGGDVAAAAAAESMERGAREGEGEGALRTQLGAASQMSLYGTGSC